MDFEKTYREIVIHYAEMAESPAAIEHARYMVKKLMQDESGLFANLGQDVKQEIDKIKCLKNSQNSQTS